MPTFTENQLKGNWGEQYIASQLTACNCLVRHVTQGHDSGIDLYCEQIIAGIPFLHFFIQVKTSKFFKSELDKIIYSVDGDNEDKIYEKIDYWKRQPVPVFIFCVSDARQKQGTPPYFICSTLNIDNSKKVASDIKITNSEELKKKFFEIEPVTGVSYLTRQYFEWNLSKGNIVPLPKITGADDTFKWFYAGLTCKYTNQIAGSIYNGIWRFCEDHILQIFDTENDKFYSGKTQSDLSKYKPFIEALASLVGGQSKYVAKITLGIWHWANNNLYEAKIMIEGAISGAQIELQSHADQKIKQHIEKNINGYRGYLEKINKRLKADQSK